MTLSILPGENLTIEAFAPAPILSAHIATYWTLRVTHTPATVHLIPDALVDLTFDFNRRVLVLNGPRDSSAVYTHTHPIELLGVSLLPGTAPALLGVPASSLQHDWQSAAEVIGPAADHLASLVFGAVDLRERMAIIDAFFVARLFATAEDPRIRQALDRIVASDGAADIEAVGRQSGASPRNLGRLFDEWVGMPPKRFARIARLQAAMRALMHNPQADLATIALELGFSDQAHLSREMQAIAGMTTRTLSDSFKK